MTFTIASTVRCPFPDCSHTGTLITKLHCRTVHNMDRKDLFKKYGQPISMSYSTVAAKKNLEGHVKVQPLNTGYPSDNIHAKDMRTSRSKRDHERR